jgi:hypothetical protein
MWELRQGHEHNHIDGRTHVHHVHLFNQVTGGEHHLQILLGCPKCRECGRPYEQNELGHLDPAAEINKALEALRGNHQALMTYAGRHGVPVRLGPLASHIPGGYKTTQHESMTLLHVPKVDK